MKFQDGNCKINHPANITADTHDAMYLQHITDVPADFLYRQNHFHCKYSDDIITCMQDD
jgi:hypothetical protein